MSEKTMITLKFPKLEKALMKAEKDWKHDNPRRGIIVLNKKAIVLTDDFCLVVDLYDYFTIDCEIDDELELKELDRILTYMDRRVFNSEFWGELTKGANMMMNNGLLFIETPKYAKDLHYKDIPVDLLEPLENLTHVSNTHQNLISCVALPFEAMQKIYSTLSQDFKHDMIILEFSGQDRLVKFTFRNRKHFFGYIRPDYDAAQQGFKFEILNMFVKDEMVKDTIEELKEERKKTLPPPPPTLEATEINVEDGPDLFGGDINSGKSWTRGTGNMDSDD